MTEIWKDVIGFEGMYQVSDLGNVKSLGGADRLHVSKRGIRKIIKTKPKQMTPCVQNLGYTSVTFHKDGKHSVCRVHRLVAIAFIPREDGKNDVNHKNGIKSDNRLSNLEWNTRQENIIHSYKMGLSTQHKLGDKDPRRKAVMQYDLLGNLIKEFSGRHEAARQTGLIQSGISACALGKSKSYGGFKWVSK